ncbi:MAG: ABC transporter substrate-binding protein [Elusimicrobia bacterium RIFOXYB2_FULL_49_7]|nr:MAG: ABC transporter substrate-binding protein [Elusimicrobia bacterium RIFOXYB2_FULL_49_7]
MKSIIKIAWRNLLRYTRRTLLTASLIAVGVALVIVFGGIGNSFKSEVIGILTNSNLGDIQIHKKGYVGSIDNLPLDISIPEKGLKKIESLLDNNPEIKAYSPRIRFGAMVSNFVQTTNMRLTAVYPEKESKTCSALAKRIKEGDSNPESFVSHGSIVIPLNISTGMNLKLGDDIVLVATNKDGSVNGMTFKVSGISENILGPQGKDGYIHIDDAKSLLRIENGEITEIAIKLNNFSKLSSVYAGLKNELMGIQGEKTAKPMFEIHTWEELSPFASIAKIVTLLIMVVRLVLISIVLISILNVMMMSVYERIGEIGTIASIGTLPSKILALFLTEGLLLGFFSAIAGNVIGMIIILIISAAKLNFTFGMMEISLAPQIPTAEVVFALVIVVIISALASLQPAFKASKMEPVEALRHV